MGRRHSDMTPEEIAHRKRVYKRWRYMRDTGQDPYTDAAPVIEHVHHLFHERGISQLKIAEDTGVKYTRVKHLFSNRRGYYQKRMRKDDAARLLAYNPPSNVVPARAERKVGCRRIMQGLSYAGWSSAVLADMLGVRFHTMDNWRSAHQTINEHDYARLVALAQKLETEDPLAHGMKRGTYNHIRSRARGFEYLPLGAWDWDTIHLADTLPDVTGQCGTYEGWLMHKDNGWPICDRCAEARKHSTKGRGGRRPTYDREKIFMLLDQGKTTREISEEIGIGADAIRHIRQKEWKNRDRLG